MKNVPSLLLLLSLWLNGCATSNTVQSRTKERAAVYSSLPAELKALVDAGQIKVGMPMDAVYIAWGQASDVVQNESEAGSETVWLYHGAWMDETRYWTHRRLVHDYLGRTYVRAEVVFVNGVVKAWRTLPQPVY